MQVCNDIRSILRIEGCDLFKRSIDRPNLFYQAVTCTQPCVKQVFLLSSYQAMHLRNHCI